MVLKSFTNTDLHADRGLANGEVVFTGKLNDAVSFANKKGYRWKADRQLIFGGYFVDSEGECLMPDLETIRF